MQPIQRALIAGALAWIASTPSLRAQTWTETPPSGRCIWRTEDASDVLVGLARADEADRAQAAENSLRRHALAHGWGSVADLVPPERSARCDGAVLSQLAAAAGAPAQSWESFELALWIADALARNGRAAEAAAVLEAHRASEPPEDSESEELLWYSIERELGRIALRGHDWERALSHFERWRPTARCGNEILLETIENDWRRVRCLFELGRFDELREVCRRNLLDLGQDPCFLEELLDSCERAGGGDAEAELASVESELDPREQSCLRQALRHRELLRLSDAELIAHLSELAVPRHVSRVKEVLVRGSTAAVQAGIAQLEASGSHRTPADLRWIRLLAETGEPCVGEALRRWRDEPGGEEEIDLGGARECWERAFERRSALEFR